MDDRTEPCLKLPQFVTWVASIVGRPGPGPSFLVDRYATQSDWATPGFMPAFWIATARGHNEYIAYYKNPVAATGDLVIVASQVEIKFGDPMITFSVSNTIRKTMRRAVKVKLMSKFMSPEVIQEALASK